MPFFQEGDGKDPVVQEIKWKVFEVAADNNTLSSMTNILLPEPWCSYQCLKQTVLGARFQAA